MVVVKDLTEITVEDYWKAVKGEDEWWGELKAQTQRLVKRLLETVLDEEVVAQLGIDRYRRSQSRGGYRNGYRRRSLLTEFGLLEEIRVPRDRAGLYQPRVFQRYQRRQARINELVREMFLQGVSTRKVQEVTKPLLAAGISAQTVSRITRSLDAEVRQFHECPFRDSYVYLLLDGITLKVKSSTGVKKRLVLCAYSITPGGKRELISFRQATAESETQWEAFLRDLYDRGLTGRGLRLISTDGCPGLHRALDTVYPYVARQRCWAHKLRNVSSRLPRRIQKDCLKEAKLIYLSETKREAILRFRKWASNWRSSASGAVSCLEQDLDELLNFLECPRRDWIKIRTTNAIERAFREVRRRIRPMSCFQNSASVDRIIYGVISRLNKKWETNALNEFTHLS